MIYFYYNSEIIYITINNILFNKINNLNYKINTKRYYKQFVI